MIAFIKHAEQSGGALRCTAVPLLLSPYLLLKGLIVSVCWFGWCIEVLTPLPPPHNPFFLPLCFCADEIKDDFDTLGPDATLQAVGNGTGESTEDVLSLCPCLSSCPCPCSIATCFKTVCPNLFGSGLLKSEATCGCNLSSQVAQVRPIQRMFFFLLGLESCT